MSWTQGCMCDDCRFGHVLHWHALSGPQADLIVAVSTRPLSATTLRKRGFKSNTIASLQRGKKLLRAVTVVGGDHYLMPTARGREMMTAVSDRA